jgi:3-(3-hydroxy-phenyl)propionate hydroxylase
MPAQKSFDVVIVGFGPAGATCANLLGSYGARTLAIDRSREVYAKPRAFALDHEIMRVFQNLGLADAVLPHTAPFTPSEYYGVAGQLIKRLGSIPPPYPLGWPPNMVFNQPPVEAALRRRASEHASVTVELGTELVALTQSPGGVRLELRNADGKTRAVDARYAIGCDGASSTVRELLGIEFEDLGFDEPWLVVDMLVDERAAVKLPQVSIQYCEPGRPTTYLIGTAGHRRWEIMLLPGEDPRAMEAEGEVWRLLARWLSPSEAKLWRSASYRFHALVARDWRRGRVFLAGDAAHQQPPFIGQGMCQGVRDVANLAWKLRLALESKAGDALLDTYAEERGVHVRRLTTAIKGIGRLICERDPAAARARDARLLADAGGEVLTQPRQHLIPPIEGGFVSTDPHPANGTVFPQPTVRRAGADVLLDEIAGSGFRIVLGATLAAESEAIGELAAHFGASVVCFDDAGGLQESGDVLAGWFEKHASAAAIVRPDHYVYGVAATAPALERQLRAIPTQLRTA